MIKARRASEYTAIPVEMRSLARFDVALIQARSERVQASASTKTAYEDDKNTEAQSYPSHRPSVTSVPLCFKSTRPKEISIKTTQLQNLHVELVFVLNWLCGTSWTF